MCERVCVSVLLYYCYDVLVAMAMPWQPGMSE